MHFTIAGKDIIFQKEFNNKKIQFQGTGFIGESTGSIPLITILF